MPWTVLVCLALFVSAKVARAQDISALGGELTSDLTNQNAIQVTCPNVSSEERRQDQLLGFITFHQNFDRREGLGPVFNNTGCGSCHRNNGKGPLRLSRVNELGTTMVVKLSRKGLNSDGSPKSVPGFGEQIRDHALSSMNRKAQMSLRWRTVPGRYPDGSRYELRTPLLTFSLQGYVSSQLVTSLRMTPAVIGPGLLEAISADTLIALSDPTDEDSDGISGRLQYVPSKRSEALEIGRFGFRGSNPTLEQQSGGAAYNDMGITNRLFFDKAGEYELSDRDMDILVLYQALAGVPRARNQDDSRVISGKALFQQIGCDGCHRMTLVTAPDAAPELRNQTIHPFTDLLLHDMGSGLADKRPEFQASGREWKTTPLWGLGFARNISSVTPHYLHDGRARSIEEAILWHDGEARSSRNQFKKLSKRERQDLLLFLKSL